MKFQINKNGISLSFLSRWYDFGFHFKHFLNTEIAVGVRNDCFDGKRVIFLDYDDIMFKEMLLPELAWLQKEFVLGDFFIFKSSQKPNSFHAICFDKLDARSWTYLLRETSCDENFKLLPLHPHRIWVLRMSRKGKSNAPVFIYRLRSKYANRREMSFVHANWLRQHHGVDLKGLYYFDESKNLPIVEYGTLNFLKKGKV